MATNNRRVSAQKTRLFTAAAASVRPPSFLFSYFCSLHSSKFSGTDDSPSLHAGMIPLFRAHPSKHPSTLSLYWKGEKASQNNPHPDIFIRTVDGRRRRHSIKHLSMSCLYSRHHHGARALRHHYLDVSYHLAISSRRTTPKTLTNLQLTQLYLLFFRLTRVLRVL